MSTYERKTIVSDGRIPPGYEVSYHENRGYDSPDRWYEAREGARKVGEFGSREDAIEACTTDAKARGWARSRYDIIAADDDEPPPSKPGRCTLCGDTESDDGSKVTWRCNVCDKLVCRECTLTIPGRTPREYFHSTLCSYACWERAGRPDE